MRMGAIGLLIGLLLAAALPGCGSSGSRSNADPASVTPASVALYVGFTVKPPGGGPRGDAASDLRRLTHLQDPFGSIGEALLGGGRSHLLFKREIEPWIGRWAAIFLAAPAAQAPAGGAETSPWPSTFPFGLGGLEGLSWQRGRGAMVLDVSDASKARVFLDRRAHEQGAQPTTYRGVRLQVSAKSAQGIVAGLAVIGSQSAVKSVIDTSLGGAPLTRAPAYLKPRSQAIASAYVAPTQLASAMLHEPHAPRSWTQALQQLPAGVRSASLFIAPEANSISLEGRLRAESGFQPLLGGGGAQAVRSLPGGSWLAAGGANVGASASRWLALLESIVASPGASHALEPVGGGTLERLLGGLSSSGARLRESLARWAGDAALFVSGTSPLDLQAALRIGSHDDSGSRAAVGELASLAAKGGASVAKASLPGTEMARRVTIAGLPAVLYVADSPDALVLGLGQASVAAALRPASTLGDSPSYAAAAKTLGRGISPSVIVEFPALLAMLEALGLTQSPPLSTAVPYLESLGTLTAGSAADSGGSRFRAVLTLGGVARGG
jgi:hypothetical protein